MRRKRHRVVTASVGLSAVLLGWTAPVVAQSVGVRWTPLTSTAIARTLAALDASSETPETLPDVVSPPGSEANGGDDTRLADIRDIPRPFAPPPPFVPQIPDDRPSVDVTGSLAVPPDGNAPPRSAAGAVAALDATHSDLAPVPAAPSGPDPVVPLPDAPAAAVIDVQTVSTLSTAAIADALKAFVAAEPVRRPSESTSQARMRQKDREAIAAFYAARDNAPLWIDGDHFSVPARAALARIDHAAEDGLDMRAFAAPVLRAPTLAQLAEAELAVSEAVVAYARQAAGGRIDPLQINRLITAKPALPDVGQILGAVPGAADPGVTLWQYNPPQPGYAALRAKLAELRQKATPMVRDTIPSGPTLKPGMRDARVPLIRSRFGLDAASAEAAADGLVYDTKVAAAVAEFQRVNGLPASGILTPRTIAALSGGNPVRLENELIANMERWRWLPRDLGTDHISVNIPDYSLDVVRNGEVVHHARVVVGKPDHQTPVFSDAMRFIIVNPYWNVPLSIINKEMMPKLAEDPYYFANHGYEVVERDGMTYVRQPPGEDNALGRIKFMFPNQHSVYLHDTNARALFGKDRRAFSHGCVRVDQPFKLAEIVLGKENGWDEKRVKGMIGGKERTINLPKPLPIHITYFTAFVDGQGGLQLRDDLYGHSGRVKTALSLRD